MITTAQSDLLRHGLQICDAAIMRPVRIPMYSFPDVVLHAEELPVKKHPQYQAAKSGDIEAAGSLVSQFVSPGGLQRS